ncbi:MAG: hypothetical protein AAGA48_41365 [Myxococcota bacterium]
MILLWLFGAAFAHDPRSGDVLGSSIEIWMPIPIARPPKGSMAMCIELEPSLDTEDTVIEGDGVAFACSSTDDATQFCVTVGADASWPKGASKATCRGDGHELRARFIAGHDPFDDPSDGVDVTRMWGPNALRKVHTVRFWVPGWADASGELQGGTCSVENEGLTLQFREPELRSRLTCRLGAPLSRDVVIRLRAPRKKW